MSDDNTTAAVLLDMIRTRHPAPGWVTITEMPDSTGTDKTRRLDADHVRRVAVERFLAARLRGQGRAAAT
jgi:hypothetical protein